jgi:four helix bundle suffix protein
MKNTEQTFIQPHGNYQGLLCYQKTQVIYDITFHFCERFLKKGDRTIDQMIQASRSGKQNIVEGCKAAGGSVEMEIKLFIVARASLEKLWKDYRDFLRVRNLVIWDRNSKEARFVRKLDYGSRPPYETFREFCETRAAEIVANIAVCLIHQANYLLDKLTRRMEHDFLKEGGLRERMSRARMQSRSS